MILRVVVPGHAATKGSPRLGRNPRTGHVRFLSDSQRLRDWTASIRSHLLLARPVGWPQDSIYVVVTHFVLPRPQRLRTPIPRQDVDKLLRASLDAGSGILWDDDWRVRVAYATKRWTDSDGKPGAHFIIRTATG